MNIAKLNDIFARQGSAAALQSARAAQMDDWIIRKLEAGEWEIRAKPVTTLVQKPTLREVRTTVDRNGDKRLVKVMLGRDFLGYQVELTGQSGGIISTEGLGKLSLAEARAYIGKHIAHPMPENAGKKTNSPAISQGMKGSSTGGSKKGK
jgi:hypothetical protein